MCPHSFYCHPIEMLFFSIQIIHVPISLLCPLGCGELPACAPDMHTRAVRYHLKFAYHDSIVRVSRYTLGIDTLHDMAYMR